MECMICGQKENNNITVRNIDLYIIGSEGLNICHECEMRLVQYIRDMRSLVATAKIVGVKIGRRT
jgi:exo-beta-1,3-glucanase (GH17 family)